ncbi:MAG TPA: uroporphyrinogen decarboxylase family protein [Capsulimonadaceae bacterium]|jgi:hypothetical protein
MPTIDENKKHLTALFSGDFAGHALIVSPPGILGLPADQSIGDEPLASRLDRVVAAYENAVRFQEAVDDDTVPFANIHTSTAIFAASFGCDVVEFEGSNPASRPLIETAAEADAIKVPNIWDTVLGRHLEFAAAVRDRVGPDVPVSGPDMQSPLGLAAQIWEKASFMQAMIDTPEAVEGLIVKCHELLKTYLTELRQILPNHNPIHCPLLWAPKELGCSVSEDEVGAISRGMYEEFALWTLIDLSETFGGLFMHCCAAADHQYPAFKKIPNLRGLNRVFQAPGPEPALRAFGDKTVHMVAWRTIDDIKREYLDANVPGVRFAFCMSAETVDEARRTLATLREWCSIATALR